MFPPAVIFDFDGVIVNTEPIHYKAFQTILQPLGLGYSWDVYQEIYMGYDDRDAFREAFAAGKRSLDDLQLRQHIEQKALLFEKIIADGVTPYPGVLELVKTLTAHSIPLAICSGALRSDILPILKQFNITSHFTTIITAEDVQQSKPHPASYLRAKAALIDSFSHLGTMANKITAIEDTPAGISSAKSANLQVVAVTNSYAAEKLAQADRIVATLDELIGKW